MAEGAQAAGWLCEAQEGGVEWGPRGTEQEGPEALGWGREGTQGEGAQGEGPEGGVDGGAMVTQGRGGAVVACPQLQVLQQGGDEIALRRGA